MLTVFLLATPARAAATSAKLASLPALASFAGRFNCVNGELPPPIPQVLVDLDPDASHVRIAGNRDVGAVTTRVRARPEISPLVSFLTFDAASEIGEIALRVSYFHAVDEASFTLEALGIEYPDCTPISGAALRWVRVPYGSLAAALAKMPPPLQRSYRRARAAGKLRGWAEHYRYSRGRDLARTAAAVLRSITQ